MALPESLSALLSPESYPHACGVIELFETHISWVILTGAFAYKLKKPVHFNFVDFSSLELRAHYCAEEVRCNRAFAPALYLGRAAVVDTVDGIRLLPEDSLPAGAEVLEWAVRMRQFDPSMTLDRMLARGELAEDGLDRFGRDLADQHAALPVHRGTAAEVTARVFGPVEDNFEEIGGTGLGERYRAAVAGLLEASREAGAALRGAFDARMTGGWVRECHGDLHLANLALVDGVVTAFDCLEFNENLRWIDTMSDVAFLFMDCHFRGELGLAYRFLDGYLDRSGDYDGVCLLHYFAAYRSVVRAKVAALRWVQAPDEAGAARFARHLRWAADALDRPPGMLLLTCGLSGSGKSYLAERLLGRLPAIRLRSDVARKRLAGLEVQADSGSGIDSGLYDPAMSDVTFDYLADVSRALLLTGENVIVDATFIERRRRDQFAEVASAAGARRLILYCDAPDEVLETRLRRRALEGGDPSEADTRVLAAQRSRFEPPGGDEPAIRVETGGALDVAALAERLASERSAEAG